MPDAETCECGHAAARHQDAVLAPECLDCPCTALALTGGQITAATHWTD